MKRLAFLSLMLLLSGVTAEIVAQIPGSRIPPRVDDHFWRRKVVNRIDLTEKINEPLTYAESPGLYGNPAYGETQGIITALINGLKSGKYLAYHPDSLNKSLTYEDVVKIAQQIEGNGGGGESFDEEDSGFDDFDGGDDFGEMNLAAKATSLAMIWVVAPKVTLIQLAVVPVVQSKVTSPMQPMRLRWSSSKTVSSTRTAQT